MVTFSVVGRARVMAAHMAMVSASQTVVPRVMLKACVDGWIVQSPPGRLVIFQRTVAPAWAVMGFFLL